MTKVSHSDELVNIVQSLAPYRQFMLYKLTPSATRPGKTDKFPCSLAGDVVSAHDSAHWVDADTACQAADQRGKGWGVAFVLTDDDPFFFIDIDGAWDGSQWSPVATDLCTRFAGAYVEVSQSGTGLHIIGTLTDSVPDHACKNIPLNLECYTEARFIALTGSNATGSATTAHDAAFNATVAGYFPASLPVISQAWTTSAADGSNPIEDDDALIAKALRTTSAGNAFGGKASFADLWERNVEALAAAYPDESRPFDASSADAALAQHLAFWTGGNCERIERLMRRSALARPKWDKHRSYMSRTICGAVGRQTSYYSVGAPIDVPPVSAGPVMRQGMQFFGINQVMEHFDGCVYVADGHQILTPNGSRLKTGEFNAMYGGYTFAMDDSGVMTTRKAWEAFTENQGVTFPKVDKCEFIPEQPFGAILEDEGRRVVNIFKPNTDPGKPGDVSVFLEHIDKLCGDEAGILLDWIAVKVQNPGRCMMWSPVLIGTQGNGKTSIVDAMISVIGKEWCTIVQSNDVDNRFNGWVFGNVFAAINDFSVGDRRDVMEVLKPIITDRHIAYQKKGVDTATCRNMLGIMITSNHRDGVIKTKDDRRYAIIYNPQQDETDLQRDGMDSQYFKALDQFINSAEGISALRHYFLNRDVANFPTRAPRMKSHDEAVNLSLGSVEYEINEAIVDERFGFRHGMIRSDLVSELLTSAGMNIKGQTRGRIIRDMGYITHPKLPEGKKRFNGKNHTVYVKRGHISAQLSADRIGELMGDVPEIAAVAFKNTGTV